MTASPYEPLLALLRDDPSNALLRLATIRKMRADGATSQALSLALDVDLATITDPADRALVQEILTEAGLPVDGGGQGLGSATEAPGTEADGPSQDRTEPPIAPARQEAEAGATVFRLVDGGRVSDGASADGDPDEAGIDFDDVAGLEAVKRDIRRRIITPFERRGLVARFRKRSGGGVLMYGPPGCGKTMLARATAGACRMPFMSVRLTDILDPHFGVSERAMSGLFDTARERAPVFLFFDEVDALSAARGGGSSTHVSQIVSHFLNEMDGLGRSNEGVLVLAATNIPWAMDAAFLRPGRFDRLFFVPPPDRAARAALFELELRDRPVDPGIDHHALARMTVGFSGADIKGAVEESADDAIDATIETGRDVPISQGMLADALGGRRSTVTDWLTTARNYATDANESGRYNDVLDFLEKHGKR